MIYRYDVRLVQIDDDDREVAVGAGQTVGKREDLTLAVIKLLNAFDRKCNEQEESCRPKSFSNSNGS